VQKPFSVLLRMTRMKIRERQQRVVERVAELAMQLGRRHLAVYGTTRSHHDFTLRQLPDFAGSPQDNPSRGVGIVGRECAASKWPKVGDLHGDHGHPGERASARHTKKLEHGPGVLLEAIFIHPGSFAHLIHGQDSQQW
jgi:hypothetical protein